MQELLERVVLALKACETASSFRVSWIMTTLFSYLILISFSDEAFLFYEALLVHVVVTEQGSSHTKQKIKPMH